MSIIRAHNLVKSFTSGESELVVLKGLDFEVARGEFVAITGRSGSGKSTLLYQLGLLDHPTSGLITIDDTDVTTISQDMRTQFRLERLGYVFQDYALLPELTALENVAVPLLMKGLSREESYRKSTLALDRVGLADRVNFTPSKLSGGQQQRVSIARAIAHDPEIVFADEPTANLDNDTALAVLETFVALHKSGQTIVMVTHEEEYTRVADRTVTLSDGVIINK